MNIREVIKLIQAGGSDRQIGAAVGIDHKTVGRYRRWATERGWQSGALPDEADIQQAWTERWGKLPAQNRSGVAEYGEVIAGLRAQGLSKVVVLRTLREGHGYTGSYSAVCQYIQRQEMAAKREVTVRVETAPGEEAQVDFGYAGLMYDPTSQRVRRAWAFVMTLSWSRHQFVRFVVDQRVETWLELHRRGFEYFGGVPGRVKLDNLKAAIVKASVDDPQVQRAYRECAEHYGFAIAPCRVRTPQHKGKVERGVAYVAGNFLAGRDYSGIQPNLQQANADVLQWIEGVAGQRVHGTTFEQPLARFQNTERVTLAALPEAPFEAVRWTTLKLHRDCYVVFDRSFYSAPYRYVGQRLAVRATAHSVQLYDPNHQLIATHTRASAAGERKTHPAHLPDYKVAGLNVETPSVLQSRAAALGPYVAQLVEGLLADTVVDRRRSIARLLRLTEGARERAHERKLERRVVSVSAEMLNQACQHAIEQGDPSTTSVRNWLKIAASPQATALLPQVGKEDCGVPPQPWPQFARRAEELLPAIAIAGTVAFAPTGVAGIVGSEVLPCR